MLTLSQCTVCQGARPLKSKLRAPYVCSRCSRDKKSPKRFSFIFMKTQNEEKLITCALPIMRVHIKSGGQQGYSGHYKMPTPMKPNPTTPYTQLAICLYRLAHGCTFLTVEDLFGVAESTAHVIFLDVCKAIVAHLYDRLVYLPRNESEWKDELQKFLEDWEFPCVGAWDGFHVYVTTELKNFYSYKKRYSITNMALVAHNKRFMFAAVGAPGSTHDSRLLSCDIYSEIENGNILPKGTFNLHPYGEILKK